MCKMWAKFHFRMKCGVQLICAVALNSICLSNLVKLCPVSKFDSTFEKAREIPGIVLYHGHGVSHTWERGVVMC